MLRLQTFEETLARLEQVASFVKSLGLGNRLGRFAVHRKNIQKVVARLNSPGASIPPAKASSLVKDFIWSIVEARELTEMLEGLALYPRDRLRKKLSVALKGPGDPNLENAFSNWGRNILFELNLEARLLARGIELDWDGKSDIEAHFGQAELSISCKRPLHSGTVRRNIQRASVQLSRDMPDISNARGLIAISLSRCIGAANNVLSASSSEDMKHRLRSLLIVLAERDRDSWRKIVNPRIVALLFHITLPVAIESKPLQFGSAEQIMIRNLTPMDGYLVDPRGNPYPTLDGKLIRAVAHSLGEDPAEVAEVVGP